MVKQFWTLKRIEEYFVEHINKKYEVQSVIDYINDQLDDELPLRRTGTYDELIEEIFDEDDDGMSVNKDLIVEALEELEFNCRDDYDDIEDDEDIDFEENEDIQEDSDDLIDLSLNDIREEYSRIISQYEQGRYRFDPRQKKKTLHQYQRQAVGRLKDEVRSKFSEYGLVMPTGSGKTFTASHFLYEIFLTEGQNVLLVAPTWEILAQHAATYCQEFEDGKKRLRRVGGKNTVVGKFPEYDSDNDEGVIILSTPHSSFRDVASLEFDVLVLDEAHFGYKPGRKMVPELIDEAKRAGVPVVHMTATWTDDLERSAKRVVNIGYHEISPEFLARCEVRRLETGEKFEPQFVGAQKKLLSPKSISEISNRLTRVKTIIGKCDKNGWLEGKVLYYAGTVIEAKMAYEEFNSLGYRVAVVHSRWDRHGEKINAVNIERFRNGSIQILINVQMLTMGFDVPDIKTIILARPVESKTLFWQICGRGFRKTKDKDTFFLVDVFDRVASSFSHLFRHSQIFDGPKGGSALATPANFSSANQDRIAYNPNGVLRLLGSDIHPTIDNFPIRDGQPFGLEFEMTWDGFGESEDETDDQAKSTRIGNDFLKTLRKEIGESKVARKAYQEKALEKDYDVWNAEYDSSAGLEITTRRLTGESGVRELMTGLNAIRKLREKEGLKFNFRTGTHLHLNWMARDVKHCGTFVKLWCDLETGLYNILAPSRLFEFESESGNYLNKPNPYSIPLTYALGERALGKKSEMELIEFMADFQNRSKGIDDSRYLAVNFQNILGGIGTVEFRALHGTDDPALIVAWLSLCMLMLHRSNVVDPKRLPEQNFGQLPLVGKTVGRFLEFLSEKTLLGLDSNSALLRYFRAVRIEESLANWKIRAPKRVA